MDALTLQPDCPLPDDVPTLQGMVRQLLVELARLRGEADELRRKLDCALKHRFGQRSERTKPPSKQQDKQARRKRTPHGRGKLPEHLERREVVHDLTEAEKLCPCCGKLRECIGEQVAEQLDMEPIRFFVLRTVKKTYACRRCSLGAAQPDQPSQTDAPPAAEASPPVQPSRTTAPLTGNASQPVQPGQTPTPPASGAATPAPPSETVAPPASQEPQPEQPSQAVAPLASNQSLPMPPSQAVAPSASKESTPVQPSQTAAPPAGNPSPPGQPPAGGLAASARQEAQPVQLIQTAGPPQVGPIAKGLCGPGLLAHVITSKFADHIPLHRLAEQLSRSGVRIARSTLGGWLAGAADLLEPLYKLMKQRLLYSRVIHSDDTGVKLRVEGKDKTTKAHLWAYIGDADYPYVVYDFTADYSGEGPQEFLKGYKGYVQADALAQYEALFGPDKAKHVCCWAHARRKYVAAGEDDAIAKEAVARIGELYEIERELPELLPPADEPEKREQRQQREEERQKRRQERAGPKLEELKEWLQGQKKKVLKKSTLGQAIGYTLNNWEALKRYLEQGYLAIDNNLSERTLRAIAVGRNNWGVIGSEAAGQTAAILYTMVATCRHLHIDVFAYLRETLPRLFALGENPTAEQLQQWLPDRWLLRQKEKAPQATPG
jgi:transposase